MNKFGAKVVTVDGIVFHSTKEAVRWQELKLLERVGEIRNLRRQVSYLLIPEQRDEKTGILLERECRYIADFVYNFGDEVIVEDTKGIRTKEYIIKRKLMLKEYCIKIREI